MNAFTILLCSCCVALTACNSTNNTVTKNANQKTGTVTNDSIAVKLEAISNVAELPVELNEPVPGGNLFVTDVSGKVWILNKDSMLAKPFFDKYGKIYKGSPNSAPGRVYSIAFHPNYSVNHKLYVSYVEPSSINKRTGKLVISQFTCSSADPQKVDLTTEKKVLQLDPSTASFNGAQIAFGPDGDLYISIGDDKAGDSTYKYRAQDLDYLEGKILRINVDKLPYSIPADNPFVGEKNARPEIWAYGFRKLWRYSFDPVTHQLFGGDVGQEMEEEIDVVKKGGNYGWPIKEGDSTFEKSADLPDSEFVKPVFTYTHLKGICVIGGDFYYGKDLPGLTNKYVFADWNGSLFALNKNQNDKWDCLPLKIVNKPSKPFFICGIFVDAAKQLYVIGYLADKTSTTGVIYKILKA
jgi:glucose/arabinose dehydrogenase